MTIDKEREINALADILIILTKEVVENPTFAIKDAFKYVHREVVNEVLASEAAYIDFYNKTGKDIRNYSWYGGDVTCKNGETLKINRNYTAEHMQTGKQFKSSLINAYKENNLTRAFVKEKLRGRYLCWVTKEEDSRLKHLGYNSNRPDPEKAYKEAGIKIYSGKITPLKTVDFQAKPQNRVGKSVSDTEIPMCRGERARIGERFTFKNEKRTLKDGITAYNAYNESGKCVGYVFECLDQRTPAYKNAELSFFNRYRNKSYCRFTSNGDRVRWLSLCAKIESEQEVTMYID